MEKTYKKITITLPTDLQKEFSKFCSDNGINISGRIAVLIREDLKNKDFKK